MVVVVFLILVGLLPPALSLWATYRAERRVVERFDLAMEAGQYGAINPWRLRDPDEHYVDGIGLVIGDITKPIDRKSTRLNSSH